MHAPKLHNRAFSLIELVIVIVIIGIIGAIAIPRMSRGAAGAADGALTADLTRLRNAIDLYQAEHGGAFPDLVGTTPQGSQLTQYSDDTGAVVTAKDSSHIYGPYLRDSPALPVGADKGKASIVTTYTATNGWVYDKASGAIIANCPASEVDTRGVQYNQY